MLCSRRQFLGTAACGFGSLAFASLLNDHVAALINLKVKSRGKTVEAQQVMVVHTNDQGQVTELWAMIEPEALKQIQSR